MIRKLNIFFNKKILIYGLGKSGLSAFHFLNKKSNVYLYDDFKFNTKNPKIKKKIIYQKEILKLKFDKIILSPGIDINKCKLSKFLKKNYDKVYTDLDVFYSFYKNNCIAITGTNGKLEYSKIFKSNFAVILNLSPDHIERHLTIQKYIKAKFKLLKNQSKKNLAFVKKNDPLIKNELKTNKFKCTIIKVDNKNLIYSQKKINNNYFSTEPNKENLSFVLEISKKLNLKKKSLLKTLKNFSQLVSQ